MNITIKMKRNSTVNVQAILSTMGVTNIEIFKHYTTCTISQKNVDPDGKINDIFNALGGLNDVKSITQTIK